MGFRSRVVHKYMESAKSLSYLPEFTYYLMVVLSQQVNALTHSGAELGAESHANFTGHSLLEGGTNDLAELS